MISDYHANEHEYKHGNFMELDAPKIKKEVDTWWKGSYKLKAALEEDCPEAPNVRKLYVMRRPCSRRTCQLSRRWRIPL